MCLVSFRRGIFVMSGSYSKMLVLYFARRLNIQRLKRQIKEMEQNGGTSEEASKEIAQVKQEIDSIKLSKDQLQKVDLVMGIYYFKRKTLIYV